MSIQFFEKALASFKKANLLRREKLAKEAGYTTADLYKAFLEGMIGSPSQTISDAKTDVALKPSKVKKTKVVKQEKPKIVMVDVLDVSTSMRSGDKIGKAVSGIRESLEALKVSKEPVDYFYGITTFSYAQSIYIAKVKKLTLKTSIPQFQMGSATALYDAIGKTLNMLSDLKNSSDFKDAKVLVNIYTDGEENSSRVFTSEKIKKMISELEENGFTITFVGTHEDVKEIQKDINIHASNTLGYDGTAKGLETAMSLTLGSKFAYVSNVVQGKEVTRGFYKTVNKK
jgi:Mg-chelatase subunit ChlD